MITRPSKLGFGLMAFSTMLYLVALQSRSGLLFLILGILFGCYILTLIDSRRTARMLDITPPDSINGIEEEPVKGTWQLCNRSTHAVGLASLQSPWGPLFRIGALGGSETVHITPELTFPTRGVYPFTSLSLTSAYPFGLLVSQRKLKVQGEIVVYPAPYDCPPPPAAGFEPMVGGKFSGLNRSSSGDRFHGVRPIQPHDPVKLIHWQSSSKGLGLMVKEFDEELSGRVAIIMDAETSDNSRLDNATRLVASLMLAALDQGHQVEFMDLAERTHFSVPPFSDGETVMKRLARIKPQPGCLTTENLRHAISHLPRKASLCFVLTSLNTEAIDYLTSELPTEKRKTAIYLPTEMTSQTTDLPHSRVQYYTERSLQA